MEARHFRSSYCSVQKKSERFADSISCSCASASRRWKRHVEMFLAFEIRSSLSGLIAMVHSALNAPSIDVIIRRFPPAFHSPTLASRMDCSPSGLKSINLAKLLMESLDRLIKSKLIQSTHESRDRITGERGSRKIDQKK